MPRVDDVVATYVAMRDKKKLIVDAHKERVAKLDDKMTQLEVWLLGKMNDGVESIKTEAGTAYISVKVMAHSADWEATYKFIVDNDRPDLLQKRLSTKEIETYAEAHEGELPPGIKVHKERVVRIRRSNEKVTT